MTFVDTEVVVVGAGPVGLLLAGELRLGGAEVLVLERLAEPTTESRASTVHARTMEILDQRGLLDALGEAASVPGGHFGGLPLDFGDLPTVYPGQWKISQGRIEELLAKWSAGLGATILREHDVRRLTGHADHVELAVACPGGPLRVRARYVVGCDGEQSTVRDGAGFAFAGTDPTRTMLRCDVTGVRVRDRRFERHRNGLAVAGTLPNGVTRVMVHEIGRPPPGAAPVFADVVEAWARVTGEDISAGRALWVNAFGDGRKQATEYRRGRVLLAGDAAHLQMPAGGQALNLGLHDAVNLGWKLAARVRGGDPPGLLDSYHAERHPAGARVLANIGAQALIMLGGAEVDPVRTVLGELLALPAARLVSGLISGLDVRYDLGDGHPLLGARLPLDAPGGRLPGLFRDGRGVLLDATATNLGSAARGWATRVHTERVTAPPDGIGPGTAVLVRPDGHIAWVGRHEQGLRAALSRWFGPPR